MHCRCHPGGWWPSTLFVVTGEGMSQAQREACDFFVYIPQHTGQMDLKPLIVAFAYVFVVLLPFDSCQKLEPRCVRIFCRDEWG